jgi:hypothetical protein
MAYFLIIGVITAYLQSRDERTVRIFLIKQKGKCMKTKKFRFELELPEMVANNVIKHDWSVPDWEYGLLFIISDSLESNEDFISCVNEAKKIANDNNKSEEIYLTMCRHPKLAWRMLVSLRSSVVWFIIDLLYKLPDSKILSKILDYLEEYHKEHNIIYTGTDIQI